MKEDLIKKQQELQSLNITPLNEERLWKKFSLEWNYHSNHIEGNTLTYGETELLLIHGKVTGTHPVRDVEEMKAHDLAIKHLRQLASDTRLLTEGDIRDLNKILLKEPFTKEAITPEGSPTSILIEPGEYKRQPNNVRLPDGSIFEFSPPHEVASRIQKLLQWLLKKLDSEELHPLEIATKLHHEFVLIHPFGDGNGRTTRLLTNYILLRFNYPPVIVRTNDKAEYLACLQQADAGDIAPLHDFLGNCLKWSLDIAIKAARSESIDEKGDLDKEVAIFIKNQKNENIKETPLTRQKLLELEKICLRELVRQIAEKLQKFNELFGGADLTYPEYNMTSRPDPIPSFHKFCHRQAKVGEQYFMAQTYKDYIGKGRQSFDLQASFTLNLRALEYQISINPSINSQRIFKKKYSEPLTSEEITLIAGSIQGGVLNTIKAQAGV